MKTDPTDGQPGLRIESAASILARDMITKHMGQFQYAIRGDRAASYSTVAAYVDGLAGVVALTIAGKHASRDEAVEAAVKQLRAAIDRDLQHLRRGV